MRYQKIHSQIWNDEKFTTLSPTQQRLFLYILTCPHGNLIGMYVLKPGYACDDLKCSAKDFEKDLNKIIEKGLIAYDKSVSLILVKRYLKHNPITNPNQVKAAKKMICELPKSVLFHEFMEVLPEVLKEELREVLSKQEQVLILSSGSYSGSYSGSSSVPVPGIEEGGAGGNEPEELTEIIDHLNLRTRKSYKTSSRKTSALIKARMNEGFTVDDFKRVIDNQTVKWLNDPKMCEYLRPETLFGTKFESYLNAPPNLAQANIVSPSSAGILGWAERKMQREGNNG